MAVVCEPPEINLGPASFDIVGITVGYDQPDELTFEKKDGTPIDITANDFKLIIAKPDGTNQATLTIGDIETDGLEIVPPNKLKYLIPAFTVAGAYKFTLKIIEPGLGDGYPWFIGKIPVRPAWIQE